ncbi:MAG TPA: efflux RND transporter periplasmic adaptor subunit [Alphaproteobacteria bacterium]|nr:efflux RND transporter periplasmic adaptor subunit [Alphaproteobacteria bacterium]
MAPKTTLAILFASLALGACEHKPTTTAKLTAVHVTTVHMQDYDQTRALTGEIESRIQSDLGFRIAGKVIARPVDVGTTVRQGDLLARLDEQDQQNALSAAQADLAAAQAELTQTQVEAQRQRDLLAKGFTTKIRFDIAEKNYRAAQAHMDSANASVQIAKDNVSYTELKADRDGTIVATGAEPGQVVTVGQMIVRLAQPSEKEAVFRIGGARLNLAPEIKSVEIALVENPAIVTHGQIREISPGVDPVTRTYTVKVALPDAPDTMRLGATVIGTVKLPLEPAVDLPSSALFSTKAETPAVWVVDRATSTVSLKPVTVVQYDTGTIVVTGGLDVGELVVTGGAMKLRPGQKVVVKDTGT